MSLTEIAEIEISGRKLKLGRNGQVSLIEEKIDAWGKTYGEELSLETFILGDKDTESWSSDACDRVQSLLNLLGDALFRLRQKRDSQLGHGREEKG